jgi:hypothetical protein
MNVRKRNKNCPSFDCGECNTFPAPYSVECGGEETKNCKWLDFDFINVSYEDYMKQTEVEHGKK